jgi:hypothetical protein
MFNKHNCGTSFNWPYVYFVRPLKYLIKKLPVPTTQAANIFMKVKSCNALLRILLVRIRGYLKSVLRYNVLNFGYYHPDSQYLRMQECEDPWLLFAPKGDREQKVWKIAQQCIHYWLQCSRWIQPHRYWKAVNLTTFLSQQRPQYAMNCYMTV